MGFSKHESLVYLLGTTDTLLLVLKWVFLDIRQALLTPATLVTDMNSLFILPFSDNYIDVNTNTGFCQPYVLSFSPITSLLLWNHWLYIDWRRDLKPKHFDRPLVAGCSVSSNCADWTNTISPKMPSSFKVVLIVLMNIQMFIFQISLVFKLDDIKKRGCDIMIDSWGLLVFDRALQTWSGIFSLCFCTRGGSGDALCISMYICAHKKLFDATKWDVDSEPVDLYFYLL